MVAMELIRPFVLGTIVILSGISSQMSFWATGQLMTDYPMFLLCFCNSLYALFFLMMMFVGMAIPDEKASVSNTTKISSHLLGTWTLHKFYLYIGIGTGLSLELQQIANGKVNPDMQSVLYQMYLPFTALCAMVYLKEKFTKWHWMGGLFVLAGVALVILPGGFTKGNEWVWVLVYALSTLPLGFACVLQEETFRMCSPNALQMSFWTTLYGTLFNVLLVPIAMIPGFLYGEDGPIFPKPISFGQLVLHEKAAFDCFFGSVPLPVGCGKSAFLPVVLYSVSYGINVLSCMQLVKEANAVTCVLIGAVVVPGTSIAAALPVVLSMYGIGADKVTPITWYVIIGGLVVVLGMLVFNGDMLRGAGNKADDKLSSNDVAVSDLTEPCSPCSA